MRKNLWLILGLLVMLHASSAWAEMASRPEDIIQKISHDISQFLTREQHKKTDNPKIFREVVSHIFVPYIDTHTMIQSIIGPRHWSVLSSAEQEAFVRLFETMVINSYVKVVKNFVYEGHKVRIRPTHVKPGMPFVMVRSVLIMPNHNQYNVNYTFARQGKGWKVIDFVINGISFVENYRAQFSPVLSEDGPKVLLQRLRKKYVKAR